MEIYKELNSPKNKEFETLLNSQLSKTKIQEGNWYKKKEIWKYIKILLAQV